MKTTTTMMVIAGALAMSVAGRPAWAQDEMDGEAEASGEVSATTTAAPAMAASGNRSGLGIGFASTLAGGTSLTGDDGPGPRQAGEIVYHVGPLMIEGLFGLSYFSPDDENDESSMLLQIGAGLFYQLHARGPASFNLGARVLYGLRTNTGPDTDSTELDIEIPARVRLDVSPHLAFNLEVGFVLGMGGQDGSIGPAPADGTAFGIGAGGTFASAGMTMYF